MRLSPAITAQGQGALASQTRSLRQRSQEARRSQGARTIIRAVKFHKSIPQ